VRDEERAGVRIATSQITEEHVAGDPLPGTPYVLVRKLGEGGMGAVYLARHRELGSDAAVKLLGPDLAADEKAMERLRREARAAAQIGNPHIIEVYDLGVADDGRPYVVMRKVNGRDLKALIDEGPVDPERVVGLVKQIASALDDVHQVGVIHRDLKPENIMVEDRPTGEHVTILDFGIARSLEEGDTDTRLTRQGQIIGTPGYMAPEQALAKPLDGRADQYSLSVIVYELLSGASPYPRITPLQLIAAQLSRAPDPLSEKVTPSQVPPSMQQVVMRGLSKEPEDRYADANAFAEALEAALLVPGIGREATVPEAVELAGPGRSKAPLVVAAAVAGLAVSVALLFPWGEAPPPAVEPPAPIPAAAPAPPPDPAPPPAPVIAPDAAVPAAPDAAPVVPDAAVVVAKATPRPVRKRRRARPRPKPAAEPPEPEPPKPEPAPAPEPAPEREPPAAKPAAPVVAPKPPAPPAAPPKLVISPAQVGSGPSPKKVRKWIRKAHGRIRACVAGLDGLSAGATATVTGRVDRDGFLALRGRTGDAKLARCAASRLKKLKRIKLRDNRGFDVTVRLRMEES